MPGQIQPSKKLDLKVLQRKLPRSVGAIGLKQTTTKGTNVAAYGSRQHHTRDEYVELLKASLLNTHCTLKRDAIKLASPMLLLPMVSTRLEYQYKDAAAQLSR